MGSWGRFVAVGLSVATLGLMTGCANGSTSYSGGDDGGGDDGSVVPPGDGGGVTDGTMSCGTGTQTACGDAGCVNTVTDPNNCGSCGKVCGQGLLCAGGMCSDTCTSTETMCPGGVDGGPSAPYCANLQGDTSNCGSCGKSCGANHVCQAGNCIINCPPSQTACPSGDVCIAIGACCTTNDCTIAGETCATPGSACACPGGQKACSANNECIVSTTCCTTTDCSISGETCSGPGGTCACPVGQTACSKSGTCIPAGACCQDSDCTVIGETCPTPGGTCSCASGFTACVGNNACISSTACCVTSDCTVTGETCPSPGSTCACTAGNTVCSVNNTCIPSNTCCTTNDCMQVTGETCTGPGGNCVCPGGGKVCLNTATNTSSCIPAGSCCDDADCTGGGTCSGPGGSCNCPAGQTMCSTNNACIPIGSCCPANPCSVSGEICSGPGGTCNCPGGDVVCGSECIGAATCCDNAQCPLTANTTGTDCSGPGGVCQITSCNSTCLNIDGQYADGCECCEDSNLTCPGAQALGTLGVGSSTNAGGHLPGSEADWYVVTFTGNTSTSYHPKVVLTGDLGMVFDMYANCSNGAMGCGDGGNCTGKTTWEVVYQATDPANPAGETWSPVPPVGTNGTVYIKVYRSSGAATCNAYTLSISNL